MKLIYSYLLNRAKERSTWVGLIAVATAVGVTVEPQAAAMIATVGATVAGLIQALFGDHKPLLQAVEEAVEEAVAQKSADEKS